MYAGKMVNIMTAHFGKVEHNGKFESIQNYKIN